jgi:undecaprenyl-diphosphatase
MFKYVILGIVQGLTEFLPVSSSAHLVILQKIFGLSQGALAISIVLHLGTVFALTVFFFKDILGLLRNIKWLLLILIVTVITGVIAISGKDFFESVFSSPRLAAVGLIFTGVILLSTRRFKNKQREMLGLTDALILGAVQGLAIIPGISRSGITISVLLFRGVSWQACFRFSFLAAIPAVLGATLLEARKINFALQADAANLLLGFIFSFFSGLFSLWLLKLVLAKARLDYFGYYCIILAVATLVFLR